MKLVREYLYETFSDQSDPIRDMEIGATKLIKAWFEENGMSEWMTRDMKINSDGEINFPHGFTLHKLSNFPDYIQFGEIGYDFGIEDSPNFTSLKGLPRKVGGDFKFLKNGIKPTEEEIREICDVKRYVILIPERKFRQKLSQAKYKELGPVAQRLSPKIDYKSKHGDLSQKYSRGYHLWKMLEFIWKQRDWDGTPIGAKLSDIIKWDNGFRELPGRRSMSSGAFDMLKRYTDNKKHRYYLDSSGVSFLKKYAVVFNDGKDFSNENNKQ